MQICLWTDTSWTALPSIECFDICCGSELLAVLALATVFSATTVASVKTANPKWRCPARLLMAQLIFLADLPGRALPKSRSTLNHQVDRCFCRRGCERIVR